MTEKETKAQLVAILKQFRNELKAVGRIADYRLIDRAIARVERNKTVQQSSVS
jgi:hypothetical protein